MKRRFSILNGDEELVLPVAPPSAETANGVNVETVNIHGVGHIHVAGYRTLANITIESFFPAHVYSFNEPDARIQPYYYVERINRMVKARKPVRLIIAGTEINISVLISEFQYGEKDGTNDVYYTLILAEYAGTAQNGGADTGLRPEDNAPTPPSTYTVERGDTLWSIAQRFLGKGSLYMLIANANGITDPNVLSVGQVLIIPEVP